MSDCSTHAFEYPGIMRLDRIVFDDGSIRQVDYPFTAVNKAVAKVIVDSESYEPTAKMMKLARTNGELQARITELEALVRDVHEFMSCADRLQWPEIEQRINELGIRVDE